MIELASLYDLSVIAEGIETEHQFQYLSSLGCDAMQGYYFAKPMRETEFIKLIEKQTVAV